MNQSFIKKRFMSFVRVLSVVAVLIGINAYSLTSDVHAEDPPKGSCEMKIRSDVNGWNNKANASGPCRGLVFGFYVPGGDGMPATFGIEGMANYDIKYSGQKFIISTSGQYLESELTVHTVLVEKPAPKPEPKPAPKPEPKPAPKQPAQKQPESSKVSVSKPTSGKASGEKEGKPVLGDKKNENPQTGEESINELESKILLLLEDWVRNNKNSDIEKVAKDIIQAGLDRVDIPSDIIELLFTDEEKLVELISFFGQEAVMELEELDGVREQLLNLKNHQVVKEEISVEEKVKEASVYTVQNKQEKEEGFFESVGSTISTFFEAIGSFFSNLFNK